MNAPIDPGAAGESQPTVKTRPARLVWPTWPVYAADEIEAVRAVLASGKVNYWTGPDGRAFEREFATRFASPYALTLANGTLALELALHAAGIGAGDEVIVPARGFVATAASVLAVGARPVFADVERDTQTLDPAAAAAACNSATCAIIPVHLAGLPCDIDALEALACAHDLVLIEDCAQAHGAAYHGRPVGSCGDIGVFSFCQDKIMSTGGEGGMLVCSDENFYDLAWSRRDHGRRRSGAPPVDEVLQRWPHETAGSNLRMTGMQAAIGRVQLRKLDAWVERRAAIARQLASGWRDLAGLRIPEPPPSRQSAWYQFHVFVEPHVLQPGWTRDRLLLALRAQGIPCSAGACPELYREPLFVAAGLAPPQRLPVARELGETALMFPLHPGLEDRHIEYLLSLFRGLWREATGA